MPEAVIVDAIRTPIGRAFKGSLKTVRADELAAIPIRALIERNPDVDFAQTVDVLMGAASGIGEQGANVGRNAALLAGLDHHVPGCTVNRFCASSLMTIRMASHAIRAGEGDQYIAAGVEAVSRAGLGAAMMDEAKHPKLDGSEGSLFDVYIPMGETAENVAERCKVSRRGPGRVGGDLPEPRRGGPRLRPFRRRDRSRHRARPQGQGQGGQRDRRRGDGGRQGRWPPARHDASRSSSQLKPAFRENGTVTAGNSCPLNDGGAAVLVMSEEKARSLGLTPKARIVASTVAAIRPELMGLGPIPAIQALLKQTGMTMNDIDIVEINEAFAAQIVPCKEDLDIPEEKLNPFGGAIALGHPFGMTGARIMTTLINGLQKTGGTYGIESMCVAGGMGQAMLIERLA